MSEIGYAPITEQVNLSATNSYNITSKGNKLTFIANNMT